MICELIHKECVNSKDTIVILKYHISLSETLECLKMNTNSLISGSISYCDDVYVRQIG
jgi:hypothetical protein